MRLLLHHAVANNLGMIHLRHYLRNSFVLSLLPVAALAILSPESLAAELKPAPQEFRQEISRQWPMPAGAATSGFSLTDVLPNGSLRLADGHRWYELREGQLQVLAVPPGITEGAGWIYVGGEARVLPMPLSIIRQIQRQGDAVWLATTNGVVFVSATGEVRTELPNFEVRQVAIGGNNLIVAATARGLWRRAESGDWTRVRAVDEVSRGWAGGDVRGVAIDGRGDWWAATPAGVIHRQGRQWTFYTGNEGLPYADFTCVAAVGSEVWFGTKRGAVRFDGQNWAYRELGERVDEGANVVFVSMDKTGLIARANAGCPATKFVPLVSGPRALFGLPQTRG